jgi:hypothetical protein
MRIPGPLNFDLFVTGSEEMGDNKKCDDLKTDTLQDTIQIAGVA